MRTIDLEELKTMYDAQIEDAKFRTYDMVNAKDYFNTPFDEGLKTAMDWGYNQQKQFDKFDDFIENVRHGCFINYDGIGFFGDWNGEIEKDFYNDMINCNVEWLEKNRKDYLFIYWYNK